MGLLSLALVLGLGTHLLQNFYLLVLPGGLCLFAGGTVEPGPGPGLGHPPPYLFLSASITVPGGLCLFAGRTVEPGPGPGHPPPS